jgi:hypothetical protein
MEHGESRQPKGDIKRVCAQARPSIMGMGQHGYFALRYKGIYYVLYCHYDAGDYMQEIMQEIETAKAEGTFGSWLEMFLAAKIVTDGMSPTPEAIEALAPYTDLDCSDGTVEDWYCLTRELQGSLLRPLQCGYIYCTVEDQATADLWVDLETGEVGWGTGEDDDD